MKILQINCVYGEGSTGKITQIIHEYLLNEKKESIVICGRRAPKNNPNVYPIVSELKAKINHLVAKVTGIRYGGCIFETKKIRKIINKERPDVVHIQCVNGYFCNIFELLKFLKEKKLPVVLTLHAEFMYTGNCSHAGECDKWKIGCEKCRVQKLGVGSLFFDSALYSWKRMHDIYKKWDNLHVVACSKWIASRVKVSGEISKRDIRLIHNGIDTKTFFYPHKEESLYIVDKYQLPMNKKYVLFVSPGFTLLKGFDLFLKLVRMCEKDNIHFLLVGGDYEGDETNLTVIGKVSDRKFLSDLYCISDVLVICSRNDTYPTVCLESIACGTPVVGFDIGGVKETISEGMGEVVPFADLFAMREKIIEFANSRISKTIIENAREMHSQERMVREYLMLYESLYDNGKK